MGDSDRRKGQRFDTSLPVHIRFQTDGTPLEGACLEISPNGMRIISAQPLVEAAFVHISFQQASNDTHCEGRVVWTRRNLDNDYFESGIDVQKWGGALPGDPSSTDLPSLHPKKDRRAKQR